MGIVLGGYQRRDEQGCFWPEADPAQSEQQQQAQHQQQETSGTNVAAAPSSLLLQEDDDDKQALLEAAKRAYQKRRPRKKKRAVFEDDGFSFGNSSSSSKSKRKSKPPPSFTPLTQDRAHPMPLITPAGSVVTESEPAAEATGQSPAGSVVTVAEQAGEEVSRQSPLLWQSPHPHAPIQQSVQDLHQKEIEALKKQHLLEMQEQLQKHKEDMEAQAQRHKASNQESHDKCQEWQKKCEEKDATIQKLQQTAKAKEESHAKDIREAIKKTRRVLEEQHAKALQGAIEQNRKEENEQHNKAIQEAVAKVQAEHAIRCKEMEEQHSKASTAAVELERNRIAFKLEEYKQKQHQQVTALQQELEACRKELDRVKKEANKRNTAGAKGSDADNQQPGQLEKQQEESEKAQEGERERKLAVLDESSNYFSAKSMQPPLISRFPLLGRVAKAQQNNSAPVVDLQTGAQKAIPTVHPFRSSASSFDLPTNSSKATHSMYPFRSSARSFELPAKPRDEEIEVVSCSISQFSMSQSANSAAAVLLELNNNAQKPNKETVNTVVTRTNETVPDLAIEKGKVKSPKKAAEKGSPYKPLEIMKIPRTKSPAPASRNSPRKATEPVPGVARASPRKRLHELIPTFQLPKGLGPITDGDRKKKVKRTTRKVM